MPTISRFHSRTDLIERVAGFAIKCWECRSDSDPKCSDPFDNSTLQITDCRQVLPLTHLPGVKSTMCRKIRQKGLCAIRSPKLLIDPQND